MLKRIAIIGPESTGKSDLARQLANEYHTEWVPEFARFYLDRLSGNYEFSDLSEIARGQMQWEDDRAEFAAKLLFCDTNLIVVKIWSEFKFDKTDPWIDNQLQLRHYDFYLLANIDLPWIADPQREHPEKREELFNIYLHYVEQHQLPFAIVSGMEDERLACAKLALETKAIIN